MAMLNKLDQDVEVSVSVHPKRHAVRDIPQPA
jgi:hypothetical protein